MATPQKPGVIAAGLRRAASLVRTEMMRAERQNAADALAVTLSYFSGPFTSKELRAMYDPYGPYSTRDPAPPAPARYVNVQSGKTREAWGMDGPRWQGDQITTVIENPTKVAEWLLTGTRRMIARPYVPAIEADIAPRVQQRRKEAWERILRKLPR